MNAVWTLGAEADAQLLYERMELWDEGAGDRFYVIENRGLILHAILDLRQDTQSLR
jgi:hypothetical protein